MHLLQITDLGSADVREIWNIAKAQPKTMTGTVAWSFQGNGIRTRTTFIQAFRDLGLAFTELPNLLKTNERTADLAGYLDDFYDLYVIRESDHERLTEFAASTRRPVINAMSSRGRPCEVLTDAYYVETKLRPIASAKVCLWGPPTNVFHSWHELADVLDFCVVHVCDRQFHQKKRNVRFTEALPTAIDIVITDNGPAAGDAPSRPLTEDALAHMGYPRLLPTPPFLIGRELSFDPLSYPNFVGYQQKNLLLPVQRAIVQYALGS